MKIQSEFHTDRLTREWTVLRLAVGTVVAVNVRGLVLLNTNTTVRRWRGGGGGEINRNSQHMYKQ